MTTTAPAPRFLVALVTVVFVIMLPPDSFCLWGAGQLPDSQPTQLMVRLSGSAKPVLTMVQGSPKTGLSTVDALHTKYGVVGQRRLYPEAAVKSPDNPLASVYVFAVDPGTDIEAMAQEYSRLDLVEYAHPDYHVEFYDVPNDPLYPHQWALNNTGQGYYHVDRIENLPDTLAIYYGSPDADIDAQEVFENPPDNTSTVVVAIVDSGVDWDHPDLASMIWNNPDEIPDNGIDDDHNGFVDDIVGWDFSGNEGGYPVWHDNDPTDTKGHGTHCAGIVASIIGNGLGVAGVAPEAKIMALKAYPWMTLSVNAACIVYAADNGADVINMSWGMALEMPIVEDALDYAASRGVVLVASAGNDEGPAVNYPASYPQTISVGATNSDDEVTPFSTINEFVNLCAPGQSILSLRADTTDMYGTYGEPFVHIIDSIYYLASGTSMSGPYVVAAAAYLRSISPGLTHAAIQEILQTTADDIWDPYGGGGHGRINLPAALAATPIVRARITEPADFDLVLGTVDIYGSADGNEFAEYVLEYSAGLEATSWTELASSTTAVTDGFLGSLDCSGLEGVYIVRLRVGEFNWDNVRVFVADSAVAEIAYPAPGDTLAGLVKVEGSAYCQNFSLGILECKIIEPLSEWTVVDSITTATHESQLGVWESTALPNGEYSMRLQVFDDTGVVAMTQIDVTLASPFSPPHGWSLNLEEVLSPQANYADVDKDGDYEIIIGTESTIRIVNTDGTLQTTDIPEMPSGDFTFYPIAVGRLDSDKYDDFVAVDTYQWIYIFPSSGDPIIVPGEKGYKPWRGIRLFLRDINGDGIDEIHVNPAYDIDTTVTNYRIYRADGTRMEWCDGCTGPSNLYSVCLPADLDGDGVCEIYCEKYQWLTKFDTCGCAGEADSVYIDHTFTNWHLSAVDIDGDAVSELIVYGHNWGSGYYMMYAFDEGLQVVDGWWRILWIDHYWEMGPVVFGDLDNDGELEYVGVHASYDVAFVRAWNMDGSSFLGDSVENGYLASSDDPGIGSHAFLCDATGDGRVDILSLLGQDVFLSNNVERVDGFSASGDHLEGFPLAVSQGGSFPYRVPTMGDINQDGFLDMVYPSRNQSLVFHEFEGVLFRPDLAFAPMLGYNRRLNNTHGMRLWPVVECGDIDGSGEGPDISDLIYLVDYMFNGGPLPPVMEEADVDGSGGDIDIADLVYLVDYMFNSGPEPECP